MNVLCLFLTLVGVCVCVIAVMDDDLPRAHQLPVVLMAMTSALFGIFTA